MIGTLIGDITANRYGADSDHRNNNTFTHHTLFSIAICDALIDVGIEANESQIKQSVQSKMNMWKQTYHEKIESNEPYSYIGVVGWLYDTLDRTLQVAFWISETIDPQYIEESVCVAACIFLARKKYSKEQIYHYYGLLHPIHHPIILQALECFQKGDSFQSIIHECLALEKNTKVISSIAGGVAEAYYNIPSALMAKVFSVLNNDMNQVLKKYHHLIKNEHPFLTINEDIEYSIKKYELNPSEKLLHQVYYSIDVAMDLHSHLIIPIKVETLYLGNSTKNRYIIQKTYHQDGCFIECFTSHHEMAGHTKQVGMMTKTEEFLDYIIHNQFDGIIIDPYTLNFKLTRNMIQTILQIHRSIGYVMN